MRWRGRAEGKLAPELVGVQLPEVHAEAAHVRLDVREELREARRRGRRAHLCALVYVRMLTR